MPDCAVSLPYPQPSNETNSSNLAQFLLLQSQCFTTAIANSTCEDTNQTCLCSNQALQMEAAGCITESCTVKESLSIMASCGAPVHDNSRGLVINTITLTIIAVLFVIQRFSTRIFWSTPIWLDDWFILLSCLASFIDMILVICGTVHYGLGRDIWTISPADITVFGIYLYAGGLAYLTVLTLLKLSLLCFYLRIFPTQSVRRILWGTIILNAVSGIVFCIVFTLQCLPISYFWNQWDGEHQGYCINGNAMGWSHAAVSIAIDIWMLIVPLLQLKSLNLNWKKKVGVGIMFSVGTFVTIMSILRLHALIKFALNVPNITQEFVGITIWSTVEINVGIICACLPSLRMLLARLFPNILGTSHQYYSSQTERGEAGYSSNRSRALGSHTGTAKHAKTSQRPKVTEGIICERMYGIELGDNDETHLVSMTELHPARSRSNTSL
ncbi:hypothetical protein BKA56DRAFT_501220 [Ilyonectria sp. MPI-CAGE-AT-0026]|nr:hypothetical protein BKA56DRAFT_501220 [Ilyonectria sp. MPI-CAGE-AT-0026]